MIDWGIVISVIAIIISLVTLYVAHLRGPNIRLADSGDKFIPAEQYIESQGRSAIIDLNLLFMNMGIRSGILFDFDISKSDYLSYHKSEYSEPDVVLPAVIGPGEGLRVLPRVTLQLPSDTSWEDFLRTKKYINVEVIYKPSTSYPWRRSKKHKIEVDIYRIRSSAGIAE